MGLDLCSVTHRYGARVALSEVSFSVEAGAFCALLGPNGAGKSTIFSLMTGLFACRSGQIRIAGHDMAREPRRSLAEMGVVFQQPTLDLDLSVRRNLRYFAALHGLSGRIAEARIDEALDRLAMRERGAERARDLNGGHRRRLELARALLHRPKVLLLDEPTVGLDAAARRAITDHVHGLARDGGLSVLWATHLTDEVEDHDRLVILHRGHVLEDGIAGELRGGQSLSAHFLALTSVEGQAA